MANQFIQSGQGNLAILDSDAVLGSNMQDADVFLVNSAAINIVLDVTNQPGISFNFISRSANQNATATVLAGAGEPFILDSPQPSLSVNHDDEVRVVYDTLAHAWRVANFQGGSGPSAVAIILTALTNGQTVYTLPFTPVGAADSFILFNGFAYRLLPLTGGPDYILAGNLLTLINPVIASRAGDDFVFVSA